MRILLRTAWGGGERGISFRVDLFRWLLKCLSHSWDNTPTPEQTPGRKMEEGTKRLKLEVSSSTACRRQNTLEILPSPSLHNPESSGKVCEWLHQCNRKAEFPWHHIPWEVHTLWPGCSSENLRQVRPRAGHGPSYLCSDLAFKPARAMLPIIPLLLLCAHFLSCLSASDGQKFIITHRKSCTDCVLCICVMISLERKGISG